MSHKGTTQAEMQPNEEKQIKTAYRRTNTHTPNVVIGEIKRIWDTSLIFVGVRCAAHACVIVLVSLFSSPFTVGSADGSDRLGWPEILTVAH